MNTVVPGQIIANTVLIPYASQATCTDNLRCRDASSGAAADDDSDALLNNYQESGSASVTIGMSVAIDKQVSPSSAPVGGTVTFTNRVSLSEGTTPALSVTDILPVGLSYAGHRITVGNMGMSIGNPSYDTRLGSGQTVTFDLGDVINAANASNSDDFIDIDIDVKVDNILANQNAVILRNGEAASGSTVTVTFSAPGSPVVFDANPLLPGLQGRPVQVIEPVLAMTKDAMPASQALGALVTYTLEARHSATSTADAFDLLGTDTLPVGLTYVPGSASPPGSLQSVAGQVLTFALSTLTQATGSATVTYQARIDVGAAVGVPLVNTLNGSWTSLPGATGAANSGRNGSNGAGGLNDYAGSDTAQVIPNMAAYIEAVKTVAIVDDADFSGDLTPLDTLEYTIVLTNTGPDVTNVVFTDPVPANTTYVAGSESTTKGSVAGTVPLVVNVGALSTGESVTIRFRVIVNDGTPAGTVISNQGSVVSDQTVPEPTDWDGNDANGDQPTDIVVNGVGVPPSPPSFSIYAPKSVTPVSDNDSSGTITQGDRMRYSISLVNDGTSPLTNVTLSDTIPAGLTYVAGSVTTTSGLATVAGSSVNWGPISLLVGASATMTFDVLIASVTPPSQTYINQGTASSAETFDTLTDGNADPVDGNQPTIFIAVGAGGTAAPVLDVQKRWTLSTDTPPVGLSSPGDTLTYTITTVNVGSAPASNVRFTDPVPVCTGALNPCTTMVPGSLVTSQGAIVGTSPVDINLGTLGVGASATVSFRVLVDPATANGVIVANQATVTANGGLSVLSDDNGDAADGRNPTLTPISTLAGGGHAPFNATKIVAGSSEPDSISANPSVVIGEVLRYRASFDVPAGVTRDVSFVDTLPPGLVYLPGSTSISRRFNTGLVSSSNPGGINSAVSGSFVPLGDGAGGASVIPLPGGSTQLRVQLGDITNSDSDIDTEGYVLEYRATVANIASNQSGVNVSNSVVIAYRDALSQAQQLAPVTSNVRVIEPAIAIELTSSGGILPGGGEVPFTLTIRHSSGAPGHDLRATIALPPAFTALGARTIVSTGATGVVDASSGTSVVIDIARLNAGGSVTVTFRAMATGPLPVDSIITTTGAVTWTSEPGDYGSAMDGVATPGVSGASNGERTGTGSVNDYTASASLPMRVGIVAIPTLSETSMMVLFAILMLIGLGRIRGRR